MNTLTNAPLADLLQRLFAEAEASAPGDSPALADLSEAELKRLMGSKTEYREFYGRLKDLALPVSRETGSLLYMLARSSSARSIVEFGTSFGLSTLHLAAALRDNGGGRLIGSEFEPSKAERARRNLAAGGCSTWWNCARATPCKPSPRTCRTASTWPCWTAPRRSTRRSSPCWKAACAPARW